MPDTGRSLPLLLKIIFIGFFGSDLPSHMLHAELFQKTLHFSRNLDFYMFWAGFVWGLYGGGLIGKCWSLVRDFNFWPARHTPQQFSPIAHNLDHLLFAFWTAGFTARPPGMGSVWCTPLFHVSNRTIVCILKQSASLYGDCMVTVWSQAKIWTQLFMC